MMNSLFEVAAFTLLAIAILGSAVLVVALKNIVHSVLWLAVTFISTAGLYLLLNADFLAMVQILVYAGAVCIMIIFAIMLIQQENMGSSNLFNAQLYPGLGVALLTVLLSVFLALRTKWSVSTQAVPEKTVENIAALILSKYVIPFEVAALLLLVALIGAIILAREVKVDATTTANTNIHTNSNG